MENRSGTRRIDNNIIREKNYRSKEKYKVTILSFKLDIGGHSLAKHRGRLAEVTGEDYALGRGTETLPPGS